jgi:hypothetical protein
MTDLKRPRKTPRRGYLLMEAVVAGSLLTIAIVSTLSLLSSARADAIYANNQGVAAMLARTKADQLAASLSTLCNPGNQVAFVSVPTVQHAQYEWRYTVGSAANKASSTPPITVAMCDVMVEVRYPARVGSRQDSQDGSVDGQGIINYRRLYTPGSP